MEMVPWETCTVIGVETLHVLHGAEIRAPIIRTSEGIVKSVRHVVADACALEPAPRFTSVRIEPARRGFKIVLASPSLLETCHMLGIETPFDWFASEQRFSTAYVSIIKWHAWMRTSVKLAEVRIDERLRAGRRNPHLRNPVRNLLALCATHNLAAEHREAFERMQKQLDADYPR